MKNVLITRPGSASVDVIRVFEEANFNVFCEPLFTVEKLPVPEISTPISAVIITSLNACFALEGIAKETKIFTVGKKTAQELRRMGFQNIILSPENSAESLFDLVSEETGRVLYFRGSMITLNFAAKLKNVEEVLTYKTHKLENFSTNFQHIRYDEVLIFSRNSMEIFADLVGKHNLLEYFADARILCLSKQILDSAKKFPFKKFGIFADSSLLKKIYD